MKKAILFPILLCCCATSRAQGIKFIENTPWGEVLHMAQKQGKPIFMDAYTTYCAPCKRLDKEVFPLDSVGAYFNANFVCVKYNMDQPEGKAVQKLFPDVITGYPSLVLIDTRGRVIHKMGGFHDAGALLAGMRKAIEGRSLSDMRARFAAGEQSPQFLGEYMEILHAGYLQDEIHRVRRTYLERAPREALLDPFTWRFAGTALDDPYCPQFEYVAANYFRIITNKQINGLIAEHRIVTTLERAVGEITRTVAGPDGSLSLADDPAKRARLHNYLDRLDIRHRETMRAMLAVHESKLAGNWVTMLDLLAAYDRIGALGTMSKPFIDESIAYLRQHCHDKMILKLADTMTLQ